MVDVRIIFKDVFIIFWIQFLFTMRICFEVFLLSESVRLLEIYSYLKWDHARRSLSFCQKLPIRSSRLTKWSILESRIYASHKYLLIQNSVIGVILKNVGLLQINLFLQSLMDSNKSAGENTFTFIVTRISGGRN